MTDHWRVEGEEFTRAEAQTHMQTHAEQLQQELERNFADKQVYDSFAASQAAVKATVLEQLNTLNRFSATKNEFDATLISARAAVRGAQSGITPEQMYEKQKLNFAAEDVSGGRVFGQGLPTLADVQSKLDEQGIKHAITEKDGLITLLKIIVPDGERGAGKGTAAMQSIIDYADKTGQHIALSPPADFGGNKKRLVDFYKRFGFVENTGKNRAFTTSETMYRQADGKLLHQADNNQTQLVNLQALEQQTPTALDDTTLADLSVTALRKEVSKRYNAKKLNTETTIDGRIVRFTGVGLREVRQHSADRKVLDLLDKSHEVMRVAIPLWSEGHTQENPGDSIRAWHYYGAKVALDGKDYFARLVVREDVNGNIYYDNDLATIESISGHIGDASPTKTGAATVSTDERSISRWAKSVKIDQLYQQQLGSFNPATNTIAIFKKGNLSTVLHELGHFFFESDIALAAELMAKPELTPGEQSIINDVSALLSWHGIQGTANEQINQWYSMDLEQKRGFHERTAEAFEAYLFTGQAPSIELQHAFQTFRTWLTHVYKSLKAFLASHPEAGKLNDDVRNIFDRMLASEDEIKLAEKARSMMPLFESAEKAGMTEADFAGYQALGADATNAAIEALQTKGLRDMQWMQNAREKSLKKMQKQHDELRRELRAKARIDVMSQPVYQAYSFLTGKLTEDTTNPDNPPAGRFDLAALQDMDLTPSVVNLMVNLKMTAKEGLHPDIVSDIIPGFSSGDELVNALANAENPKAAIEKLTDERMLQDHAELATPEAIERAADVAVHNEVRARFVTTEANALAKATGSLRLLGTAAKEYAEAMISRQKVRDIQPIQHSRAEVKAARAAAKASQQGDIEQAAIEKRNQVLNLHLARAAYAAKDNIEAGVRYFRKFDGKVKNIDADYLDQIQALASRNILATAKRPTR